MGSEDKYTSWFGDIYKKVGTLCSEIDNIISQESLLSTESQLLSAGVNVKQFTEKQLLVAGANVRQFAEDKFSTTGENVKQFCSDFMQEVIPDFLKDSFLKKTQSEDTEKCDSSVAVLKKEDKCDNSDRNEMILELNNVKVKVNVIPSETSRVDVSEKNDVGIATSIGRVDESHDGVTDDLILLQAPGPSEQDCYNYVTLLSRSAKSTVLENDDGSTDTCTEFVDAEDSVEFSRLDEPDTRETTGLYGTETEPLDDDDGIMVMNHYWYPISSDKNWSASDLQMEKEMIQELLELMETVESDEPQGMKPKKPKHEGDSESSDDDSEFSDSEWEII